ncbi:MAG: hypothetical protein Q8P67_12385, partial [archaeon]|nr:hypothetical protein [archaeon]
KDQDRNHVWFQKAGAVMVSRSIGGRYADLTPVHSKASSQYLVYTKFGSSPIYDLIVHPSETSFDGYQAVCSTTSQDRPASLSEHMPSRRALYLHVSRVPQYQGQSPIVDIELRFDPIDPTLPPSFQPVCENNTASDLHAGSPTTDLYLFYRRKGQEPVSQRHPSFVQLHHKHVMEGVPSSSSSSLNF